MRHVVDEWVAQFRAHGGRKKVCYLRRGGCNQSPTGAREKDPLGGRGCTRGARVATACRARGHRGRWRRREGAGSDNGRDIDGAVDLAPQGQSARPGERAGAGHAVAAICRRAARALPARTWSAFPSIPRFPPGALGATAGRGGGREVAPRKASPRAAAAHRMPVDDTPPSSGVVVASAGSGCGLPGCAGGDARSFSFPPVPWPGTVAGR